MKRQVILKVTFDRNELTAEHIKTWVDKTAFFSPTHMSGRALTKNVAKKYNAEKFFAGLAKEVQGERNFTIRLSDEEENMFSVSRGICFSSLIVILNYEVFQEIGTRLLSNIDDIFQNNRGIVGFLCSAQDNWWQNEKDLEFHVVHNRPIEHLKTTKCPLFPTRTIVDVEFNPGHSHSVNELWFGSCWTMWFGEKYFQYIPKDVLKKIEVVRNEELENGSLRITLYETPWDYEKFENREMQWKFRRQAGIDLVAHQLMQSEATTDRNPDPEIEIFTGEFAHGGSRFVTYYYDGQEELTAKSKAVKSCSYEFSEDGSLLWSTTETLN